MKTRPNLLRAVVALGFLTHLSAFAQGTAFSYQGRLSDGAGSANGIYDLRFAIYDSTNIPGTLVSGPLTKAAVTVRDGLFTTALDFGNVFTGADRWLEIAVSTNGANDFTTLAPRQPLTPAPYAVTAAHVSGTLSVNQLPPSAAFLDANQTFTGQNTFSSNLVVGKTSFDANGTAGISLAAEGGRQWTWQSVSGYGGGADGASGGSVQIVDNTDNKAAITIVPGNNVGIGISMANSAGLITTSDRRVKKDIEPIRSCLDRVMALEPSTFRYQGAEPDSPVNYGFIAQDVEKQFPELVQERRGLKTLVGSGLTAINTRAIQDLNRKLEDQLKAKDAKISEMEKRLTKLEHLLTTLAANGGAQ